MQIDKDYIPDLIKQCSYTPFKDDVYTMNIDDENPRTLQINAITKQLLDQVNGRDNLEQITYKFNHHYHKGFTVDDIVAIFNKRMLGYGIFTTDNTEKIKVKDNYIHLRMTLIPARYVRKLTPLMTWLFGTGTFITLLVASILLLTFCYLTHLDIKDAYHNTTSSLFYTFLLVNYGSLILHELGHAAACEKYGAQSGSIGFGFYFVAPVFFSDVTDAWRLKRYQRLIVDLGGIYIQLLICVGLVIAYYITRLPDLLYFSFGIALTVFVNINPLLRYDGYWLLSDALNISNFKEKALQTTGRFYGRIVGINKSFRINRHTAILLVYGLCSIIATISFIVYMLVFNNNSLLLFPARLYTLVQDLLHGGDKITFDYVKRALVTLVLPFFFYFMFLRNTYLFIRKKIAQRKQKKDA